MDQNQLQLAANQIVKLFNERAFTEAANQAEIFLQSLPSNLPILNIAGAASANSGQHNKAIVFYKKALAINPAFLQARVNLAGSYYESGNPKLAIQTCLDVLRVEPDNLIALKCLGLSFEVSEEYEKADLLYRNMIKAFPNDAVAYTRLGVLQMQIKEYEASRELLVQAVKHDPNSRTAQIFLYMLNARLCDWDALDAMEAGGAPSIEHVAVDSPYDLVILKDDPEAELACASAHAERFLGDYTISCPAPSKAKDKRIHVAIVSPDLRKHPCGYVIEGILDNFDRSKFKFSAFSLTRGDDSDIYHRLQHNFDDFHEVYDLSDSEVVALSRRVGVDIAIDLAGYTQGTRAQLFAKRLAPIQINMLGYAGTLGAPFYDYIVVDSVLVPEHNLQYFSETPLYMPDTYWPANSYKPAVADVKRADYGIPETAFVFYCFNRLEKIRREEFTIWMSLLREIEGSVLWLLNPNVTAFENLKRYATELGVDADRLLGAKTAPINVHHARQTLGDLFLDNFNYNAHTTAWDALRAGVPIVTKIGNSFSARVAGSILTAANLPELITHSEEDYRAAALKLASDPVALADMKSRVKESWTSSAFFDPATYTRHLESGFEQAYDRMENGQDHSRAVYANALL